MLAVAYVVGVLKPSFLSLTGTSHTIMGYHGYRFYNCYPVQMFKSYFKSLYRLGPKSFHQQSLCLGMLSQSMEWGFKRGQATMVHRPHIPLPSSVTKNRSEAEYGAWKKKPCVFRCVRVCVCLSVFGSAWLAIHQFFRKHWTISQPVLHMVLCFMVKHLTVSYGDLINAEHIISANRWC